MAQLVSTQSKYTDIQEQKPNISGALTMISRKWFPPFSEDEIPVRFPRPGLWAETSCH